jgi:hypothetical protein
MVSHSHGGNVTLKAIDDYLVALFLEGAGIALGLEKLINSGLSPDQGARQAIGAGVGIPEVNVPSAWVEFLLDSWSENLEGFPRAWARSPSVNRLGRVVFMGTPFLRQHWLVPTSRTGRAVRRILRAGLDAATLALSTWALVAVVASALGTFDLNAFDLRTWPRLVLSAMLTVTTATFLICLRHEGKRNVNMYFDPVVVRGTHLWSPIDLDGNEESRIEALVVSAQYLDEAMLGFSSMPVARGVLSPRVDSLLDFRPRRPYEGGSTPGDDPSMHGGLREFRSKLLAIPLWFLYWLVQPVWQPIKRLAVKPIVEGALVAAMSSAAFGVDPNQFRGSRVIVSALLDTPSFFDERVWDVTDLVLRQSGTNVASTHIEGGVDQPDQQRFSHLLNDVQLESKLVGNEATESGRLWRYTDASMNRLYRIYRRAHGEAAGSDKCMSKAEYRTHLGRVVLTAEERLREFVGATELTHSLYYSNPAVVRAVARFLSSGNWPSEATLRMGRLTSRGV